ncbi:MAG TPA: universal stress protein [Jatrophihabitans sp.]|nr:universal stress protein [Jatrophihabitans sp.]
MSQPQVVVGIDGSATAQAAMLWAAAEAARRHAELLVVHAGDAEPGVPPAPDVPTAYGRSLVAEAAATVYETGFDGPVRTVIVAENPVHLLTRLSEQSDLVVVGSHGLGRGAGALLGSVAFRVAAHARCPVTVVPSGWDEGSALGRPVVVGVPASVAARSPLYVAFAQARARGVPVRAVRTWSRTDWTGELVDVVYATSPAFEAKQQEYVDRMLAPVREVYPDVPVQTVLSGQRIDDLLLHETDTGALLVVGTRFADGHTYSRLGPTTARLVHRAHCPVLVVGRTTWRAVPELAVAGGRQPEPSGNR